MLEKINNFKGSSLDFQNYPIVVSNPNNSQQTNAQKSKSAANNANNLANSSINKSASTSIKISGIQSGNYSSQIGQANFAGNRIASMNDNKLIDSIMNSSSTYMPKYLEGNLNFNGANAINHQSYQACARMTTSDVPTKVVL